MKAYVLPSLLTAAVGVAFILGRSGQSGVSADDQAKSDAERAVKAFGADRVRRACAAFSRMEKR
jgi:hypothetical protein